MEHTFEPARSGASSMQVDDMDALTLKLRTAVNAVRACIQSEQQAPYASIEELRRNHDTQNAAHVQLVNQARRDTVELRATVAAMQAAVSNDAWRQYYTNRVCP